MDDSDRISLIRRGNELYNKGDIKNALKVFLATEYQDGIVRVADHLYYEENNKIAAIKLYKKAGYQKRIDEFAEKAAICIQMWLECDRIDAATKTIKISTEQIKEWKPINIKSEDIVKARMNGDDVDLKEE